MILILQLKKLFIISDIPAFQPVSLFRAGRSGPGNKNKILINAMLRLCYEIKWIK